LALVEYYGTGRRKTSTARVHLRQGTGQITVNGRPLDEYFANDVLKMIIKQPLSLTETGDKFDIVVTVDGRGTPGRGQFYLLLGAGGIPPVEDSVVL